MKKEQRTTSPANRSFDIRRKMITFAGCVILAGNVAFAQNAHKVTLQFKQAKLENVLSAIKDQTGLRFVYSDEDVATLGKVSIDVKNMDVTEALNRCLQGSGLSVSVRDNTIVISPATKGGVVKGVVLDSTDELPMVGVNVAVIKGKDQKLITGVTTDMDGRFSVEVPRSAQIRITSVGYKEIILNPTPGKDLNIRMVEDTKVMDEVVVNGFFTRTKQTFTGAAKTYTSEELLRVSPTNIFQALSTLDPGMTITQNNAMGSNPNAIPDLVIRSTTSLSTGNETGLNAPLIVIDGVESTIQALYDIDMQDIERVDVLKDASATALYGENAANGVIIIERKRVSQSPVRIRYTFTPQLSFADLSSYDLCNAAQKLELERRAGLTRRQSRPGILQKTGTGEQRCRHRLDFQTGAKQLLARPLALDIGTWCRTGLQHHRKLLEHTRCYEG